MVKLGLPYWAAIPIASVVCSSPASCSDFPRCDWAGSISRWLLSRWPSRLRKFSSYKGFDAWTGGSQGLQLMKPHAPFGLKMNVDQWTYSSAFSVAAILFLVAHNLINGRVGRALVAIRDHPIAAETMGVDAALYKTTCFGVSALYAGVAGGLSAIAVGFVSPEVLGSRSRSHFSSGSSLAGSPRLAASSSAPCSSNSFPIRPTNSLFSSARARRRSRAPSMGCC